MRNDNSSLTRLWTDMKGRLGSEDPAGPLIDFFYQENNQTTNKALLNSVMRGHDVSDQKHPKNTKARDCLKVLNPDIKQHIPILQFILTRAPFLFEHAKPEIQGNRKCALAAISFKKPEALAFAGKQLLGNWPFMAEAITKSPGTLKFVPDDLHTDNEIARGERRKAYFDAITSKPSCLKFAGEYNGDEAFVLAAASNRYGARGALKWADKSLFKNEAFMCKLVAKKACALAFADPSLLGTSKLLFIAAATKSTEIFNDHDHDWTQVKEEVIHSRDSMIDIMTKNPSALTFAAPELMQDPVFVRAFVTIHPFKIRLVSKKGRINKEFLIDLIVGTPKCLQYARVDLGIDADIVLAATLRNPSVAKYVSHELLNDEPFMRHLFTQILPNQSDNDMSHHNPQYPLEKLLKPILIQVLKNRTTITTLLKLVDAEKDKDCPCPVHKVLLTLPNHILKTLNQSLKQGRQNASMYCNYISHKDSVLYKEHLEQSNFLFLSWAIGTSKDLLDPNRFKDFLFLYLGETSISKVPNSHLAHFVSRLFLMEGKPSFKDKLNLRLGTASGEHPRTSDQRAVRKALHSIILSWRLYWNEGQCFHNGGELIVHLLEFKGTGNQFLKKTKALLRSRSESQNGAQNSETRPVIPLVDRRTEQREAEPLANSSGSPLFQSDGGNKTKAARSHHAMLGVGGKTQQPTAGRVSPEPMNEVQGSGLSRAKQRKVGQSTFGFGANTVSGNPSLTGESLIDYIKLSKLGNKISAIKMPDKYKFKPITPGKYKHHFDGSCITITVDECGTRIPTLMIYQEAIDAIENKENRKSWMDILESHPELIIKLCPYSMSQSDVDWHRANGVFSPQAERTRNAKDFMGLIISKRGKINIDRCWDCLVLIKNDRVTDSNKELINYWDRLLFNAEADLMATTTEKKEKEKARNTAEYYGLSLLDDGRDEPEVGGDYTLNYTSDTNPLEHLFKGHDNEDGSRSGYEADGEAGGNEEEGTRYSPRNVCDEDTEGNIDSESNRDTAAKRKRERDKPTQIQQYPATLWKRQGAATATNKEDTKTNDGNDRSAKRRCQ